MNRYCGNCGNLLYDGTKFCGKCGRTPPSDLAKSALPKVEVPKKKEE